MSDKYEELEKLQSLKEREIISEEEFQREKEKILNAPEKNKIDFDFKKIGINIKDKKTVFIIIAVMLVIIAIIFGVIYKTNFKQYQRINSRHTEISIERVEMERKSYYDTSEYKELCEKEDELAIEFMEYYDTAYAMYTATNICTLLSFLMCLLHAVFTLKGNNLSKKEFFKKIIIRMIIPIIVSIIIFSIFKLN